MGTVAIGVDKEKLNTNISICLKNYLDEINPKLNTDEKNENKLDKKNSYLIKTGYQNHIYGFVDGKYIMVLSEPRPYFHNLADFKVIFHQSQWSNQREVAVKFTEIFKKENAFTILCDSKLYRSDFWIDAELTYEEAKEGSYRPYVSVSEQIRSDKRSYYLGSKGNKQSLFYEKKNNGKTDVNFKKKRNSELMVRFEVRYFSKLVPIDTYADYFKTSDMNLFDHLDVRFFNKEKFLKAAKSKRLKDSQAKEFISLVEKEGLHFARKKFSKNHDFYRKIKPVLDVSGRDLKLSKRWKKKVTNKIVNNFDINEYFTKLGVCNE